MHADSTTAMEYASRIAAGHVDQDSLRWVQQGLAAYIRSDCGVPLERCLHLANTPKRRNLMRRNVWLAEAAKLIQCESAWHGAVALAGELDRFLSRGHWLSWRTLERPPEGSSGLRSALFWVAKANDAKALSAKQIHRIVGHVFE